MTTQQDDSKKGTAERRLKSLYSRPVAGAVRGTYVVAPLTGSSLEKSRKALITCIIKVHTYTSSPSSAWP